MLASKAPPASGAPPASKAPPVSIPTVLLPECIWLDIPCITRSGLPHGENQVGGTVSRPHRSLDGCRQPRISPVAGEKQVFKGGRGARPQGVLLRRGLEGGAALAHDLPRRHFALHTRRFADIPPDRLRELLSGHIDQPVAIADGNRQALREREQPLH